MWFLFGFITLISFSVYLGIKRYKNSWKGKRPLTSVVPYVYDFVIRKDKARTILVGVDAPTEYDFSFKREGLLDRVCKLLGLVVEHQVGSESFDNLVYIVSNDRHFLENATGNPRILTGVIKLFKLHRYDCSVTEIRCAGGRLWATFKVGRKYRGEQYRSKLQELLPHAAEILHSLSVQLQLDRPATPSSERDPFILRAAVLLAISSGMMINGATHLFRQWWATDEFTVDVAKLWLWSGYGGALLIVLLIVAALRLLGRSARTHLVLIELLFVGWLGATLTVFSELRDLNMEMDTSPSVRMETKILNKTVSRSRKGGTNYSVEVEDWNSAGRLQTTSIKVSRHFFDSIRVGNYINVSQRSGYLGIRWVEAYAPAASNWEKESK